MCKETVVREPINPALKIALNLHDLGTGTDYHSLQWVFHVPHNTINGIDDFLTVLGAIVVIETLHVFETNISTRNSHALLCVHIKLVKNICFSLVLTE